MSSLQKIRVPASRNSPPISLRQRHLLEAGVRHLHRLGARATFELLVEFVEPVGEVELLLTHLGRYRHITPELLRAVGGDRFPRHLTIVPDVA